MSFERNLWGFDGELTFICDECNNEEHTEEAVFVDALQHIEDYGWRIIKVNKDYHHFCSEGCFEEFRREELEGDFI